MKDTYYIIWSDLIIKICQLAKNKKDWKLKSLYLMTILLSINIMTVQMWIGYYGNRYNIFKMPSLDIDIFPRTMFDSFLMYLILFGVPSFGINYFAIFYNDRYKVLIKKYSGKNGVYFLIYMFGSIAIFIVPIIIRWLGQND